MTARPWGAKEFQRLLQRHAAEIGQLPQRVMHLVRVGVVCAMLDDVRHDDGAHLFIVKGGTAMQLRVGIQARATTGIETFRRRQKHAWPPTVVPSASWARDYPLLVADHPDAPSTIEAAIEYLSSLIERINAAR